MTEEGLCEINLWSIKLKFNPRSILLRDELKMINQIINFYIDKNEGERK